ncbi:hypothetical protein [Pseudomonas sp. EA_65y_Pfl1_P120]|uniref:hypothetical protein n=1 Tax=Pseudomonas sp. EA_65y_Pfl1_P120 TaxID=3088693 RepID=UPI0030D8AE0D
MSEWDYDDRPELPPESGDLHARQFDPNDTWLATAPRELQIEAMRCWFYARYQDPVHDTPYNGSEGGYLFIHGGPFDPNDVIQERFDKTVEFEVMEELIAELHQAEGGDEWAPIDHDDEGWDYEDIYSLRPEEREDPLRMLDERLEQIEDTIKAQSALPGFVIHLLHSAAITALEAYLWDTTSYWVTRDKEVLRSFVKNNKDFAGQKFQLSDVFIVMDDLERKVADYLQTFIWHRLDKVKPLLELTLGINFPEIEKFIPEIIIRHDIVHRGGRDKDGYPVLLTIADVRRLAKLVEEFSQELESQLKKVFPIVPIIDDF